jgi:hypothetical protein
MTMTKSRSPKSLERKPPKKVGIPLTENQIIQGAKFLAMANFGCHDMKTKFETEEEFFKWYRQNYMRQADGGVDEDGITGEITSWVKMLRKKDPYTVEQVVKFMPCLFQQ